MPYFVVPKPIAERTDLTINDECLSDRTRYASRADAYAALQALPEGTPKHAIAWVADPDTTSTWQRRERIRFDDLTYRAVPWHDAGIWAYDLHKRHYTHMSLLHLGLVAYTPDDESGANDRQVRTTPAKYLLKFAAHLDKATIDQYVAEVKAFDGTFKIATTADDIERLYVGSAIGSCMTHAASSYSSKVHPVRAYGDSDLAVAYLGPIDRVTSRCIIWPSQQVYTRIYGDETLGVLLKNAGYRKRTSMAGAKIRAIADRRTYVMPYIDWTEYANRDGSFFVLSDDDDSEYSTQSTNGLADENDTARYTCERCNDRVGEDEQYCESCNDDRMYCEHCDNDYFDVDGETIADQWYCDSCARELSVECAECSEPFWQENFSRRERADRTAYGVTDYCSECADGNIVCSECDTLHDRDEHCPDCTPEEETDETPVRPTIRCDRTMDLPLEGTTDLHATMRPLAEYASDAGPSLDGALRGGQWRIASNNGQCLIYTCHQPIAIGRMFLLTSHGFGYCRSCVDNLRDRYTVVPFPDRPFPPDVPPANIVSDDIAF